ncbi:MULTISPECIES: stalk domain-containing protein [unclassified Paenibacillus]|uniref:stalk domain-containing protein n=1 Tax=unclassified Paenibacillus TaxID=185978 RepID=UPI002780A59B|nr:MULTISPECIES: stalk domain-containing protein [unclassified Paenibacillus]MDQ0896304.1 hypothetical protein [Paenibacillus sp. V4I7]MDQ0913768.1 hypothetical protein [Paenibacillus sp. V4I5]
MKKRINKLIIASSLLVIFSFSNMAMAVENPIVVTIDGQQLNFEVAPIIQDGTTLVPVRTIFETLGLSVGWDEITKTIIGRKDGLNIQMKIGNTSATVNGKTIILEVPPMIVNGSTLVPLRFIGESSGNQISWDGNNRRIDIKGKGITLGKDVTRAEVSRFLVRSLGLFDEKANAELLDVSDDNPFYKDIASAIQNKLMYAYEDHNFRPERTVSRFEYAITLTTVLNLPYSYERNENSTIKDYADMPGAWGNMVQAAFDVGLINLNDDGKFNGNSPLKMNLDQPNMKLKELKEKYAKH